MNETEQKALKELENASKKYRKDGDVWSISVAKRMIEDADQYDPDVIKVWKNFVDTYYE